MFGNNGQSGSIPVKTVCAAEDKGLSLLRVVPHQSICQGVFIIVQRRMDRHSGRFVDNKDIIVFIYNMKRKLNRRDIWGAFYFLNMYREGVPGGKW